jgi:8-oxo-dGTP pyrophosphatase MutT (NUDIX family)
VSAETGPVVVAKAVLLDTDDQALLLERSFMDKHRPGGVDLPGGSANRDESGVLEKPVHTAVREILEEAGVELRPADLEEVAVLTDRRESDGREFRRHLFVGYLATRGVDLGVKTRPEEHGKHWWTPRERLEVELEGTHWVGAIRMARANGHFIRRKAG